MKSINNKVWAFLAVGLLIAGGVFAQGVQTATLTGSVTAADGSALPGVTVTVSSPAMIGERSTVTGVNGDYILRGLPPGVYKVVFALEGMTSVENAGITLPLGGTSRSDAKLEVAAAEETIVVTGEAPSALETTTVGANLKKEQVDALPTGRGPAALPDLVAGLTDNGPLAGQFTINGGMAYDNSILINGINVQDPIFGRSDNLFIEDSIEESQVMTSGISAEYGAFTGGVINIITKSGGNSFAGSFRADFDRPEWRDETPFEKARNQERKGDLNKGYTATLGGPIVKDRLWFFLAGLQRNVELSQTLAIVGTPFTQADENTRYEVKLTGNITPNHSVQVAYINNDRTQTNNRQLTPIDLKSLTFAEFPNDGFNVGYSGVFSNSLFGELRYSEKAFQFKGLGGSSTNPVNSPFRSQNVLSGIGGVFTYNAPYFDATDPEDRNNEQYYGSLSYFLSTESAGSHDLKAGVERFTVIRTGGNSQTSTGRVYYTDYVASGGRPVLDAGGFIQPIFTPGLSGLGLWAPTRGARLELTTDSFFLNDRWQFGNHLSVSAGIRYEVVSSSATSTLSELDTKTLVPRLGVSYDINGDGKYKVDVTYAEYAGRYNPSIFGRNTPVGNPALLYGYYIGPAGTGVNFAPGFNPNNYFFYYASVPGRNIFFENGLSSPVNSEYTISFGMALPKGGFVKGTFVNRELEEMIDDFVTINNGKTQVSFQGIDAGTFDNIVYRNTSVPKREYQSAQVVARYNVTNNWSIEGNYTHQFKNDGNYEGEGGQSIGTSPLFNQPEFFDPARNFPEGRLTGFQSDRVRLFTTYNLNMGRAGSLSLGLVWKYDSPLTFSYSAANVPLTSIQRARDPGYARRPSSQTLFFGERGAGEFNSTSLFDLALTYRIPVWKSFEPYVRFDVRNVLNDDTLVTYSTSISRNTAGPLDSNGLPTTYIKGSTFGTATSAANYVTPREYFIAFGFRF